MSVGLSYKDSLLWCQDMKPNSYPFNENVLSWQGHGMRIISVSELIESGIWCNFDYLLCRTGAKLEIVPGVYSEWESKDVIAMTFCFSSCSTCGDPCSCRSSTTVLMKQPITGKHRAASHASLFNCMVLLDILESRPILHILQIVFCRNSNMADKYCVTTWLILLRKTIFRWKIVLKFK